MDISSFILLLVICGISAHFVLKWWWPIIKECKNLTPEQMIERALQAPAKGALRQGVKFGSQIRTLVNIVLNARLLCAWLWISHGSFLVLWLGIGYLTVGFMVQHLVKVPGSVALAKVEEPIR